MRAATFQDDDRENRMIELFNLYKDGNEGRSGVDAFLDYNGQRIPFELKTTSQGSVTTVRDFGPDHIQKWKNRHWLIGFFIQGREYYKYGSPRMMEPWIREKELYISPDFKLAGLLPEKISLENMYEILSRKKLYTYEDAQSIQKKQYKKVYNIDYHSDITDINDVNRFVLLFMIPIDPASFSLSMLSKLFFLNIFIFVKELKNECQNYQWRRNRQGYP